MVSLKDQAGFTLLEVCVSTAITGIVMLGVAAFGFLSDNANISSRASAEFNSQASMILSAMSDQGMCSYIVQHNLGGALYSGATWITAPSSSNLLGGVPFVAPVYPPIVDETDTPVTIAPFVNTGMSFLPSPIPSNQVGVYVAAMSLGAPLDKIAMSTPVPLTVQPPNGVGGPAMKAYLAPIYVGGLKVGATFSSANGFMLGSNVMMRAMNIMLATTATGAVVGCY